MGPMRLGATNDTLRPSRERRGPLIAAAACALAWLGAACGPSDVVLPDPTDRPTPDFGVDGSVTDGSVDQGVADQSIVDLSGPDLSGRDMNGPDLSGPDMSGPDMRASDMSGPDMSGTDMAVSDMSGADMRSPDMTGDSGSSDLGGGDMADADMPLMLADAILFNDCGPAGGPARRGFVVGAGATATCAGASSTADVPRLEYYLIGAGPVWTVGPSQVTLCTSAGCENATAGDVELQPGVGSMLRVALTFPSRAVVDSFSALVCENVVSCR